MSLKKSKLSYTNALKWVHQFSKSTYGPSDVVQVPYAQGILEAIKALMTYPKQKCTVILHENSISRAKLCRLPCGY